MDDAPTGKRPRRVSRRRFLGVAATLAGGAALRATHAVGGETRLRLAPDQPLSRVVVARETHLIDGPTVHRTLLAETLQAMLLSLTGKPTPKEAWATILKPDDIVGLKFNRSGQGVINTSSALADVLIESLGSAGWGRSRIVGFEFPREVESNAGTLPPRPGYDAHLTDFSSGADHFASALGQITALINVPFLKTHNLAGMTCSLKNLSHGLIKHPARYHAAGCSPYIADIVAADPIRSKLRLTLVDAMRVVYKGGPSATARSLANEGVLLMSRDPVAVDAVALEVLNRARERFGLPEIASSAADIPYLAAAHRLGLGIAVRHGIKTVRILGP